MKSNSNQSIEAKNLPKLLIQDHNNDGIDRRGFLQCMAWAGTGVIWTVSSGVLNSRAFGQKMKAAKGELHFVQISDSHMGFNKPANPDVAGTLQRLAAPVPAQASAGAIATTPPRPESKFGAAGAGAPTMRQAVPSQCSMRLHS